MGMKPKNIRIVIRKKIANWLKSIKDDRVRNLVKDNIVVTGGSIASMLLGEEVHDFDVYFRTKEVTHEVAKYYAKRFKEENDTNLSITVECLVDRVRVKVKSAGAASEADTGEDYQYFEGTNPDDEEAALYLSTVIDSEDDAEEVDKKAHYRPIFMTANAITLADKVQIVTRFFGEPQDIHENYDFIHCTSYYTSWNGHLHLPKDALTSLLSKELRYVGSKYPICSIMRLRKFLDRGWHITAGQIMKICWQTASLDLQDPEVLEEQMTGVDFAYFQEVIQALKERNDKVVDAAYLFELLDKIF